MPPPARPPHTGAALPRPIPEVSVVMAVYDGERYLAEAIDSVLTQSLRDLELVVVDDGSNDATPAILADYSAGDGRVVVKRQHNTGRVIALNRGVAIARGALVARLDADDVAMPDRLERQREFLCEHPETALVGGAARLIDERGRAFGDTQYPTTDAAIRRAFAYTTPFVHSAVMLRREAFDRIGGYRTNFPETEDLDLWLRLAERHELANLPQLVVAYRMHGGQATVRQLELQALCCVAAHVSARARARREPDPFDDGRPIGEPALLAHGATREEITATLVRSATWLGKTIGRAADAHTADALLALAHDRARSASGSAELVAIVHRARAQRHAEQGRRARSTLERARALVAGRRSRPAG